MEPHDRTRAEAFGSCLLVIDGLARRRTAVVGRATALHPRVVPFDTIEPALALANRGCVAAVLVAVDADLLATPGFGDLLQTLRRLETPVLCYAHAAASWPIAGRCQLLLRGAHLLYDSATATFTEDLARALGSEMQRLAQRQQGDQRLLEVMAALGIVGSSAPLRQMLRTLGRLAALSDLPALILGETGTGKELVAAALHQLDPLRRDGPFIALNCAALPASLAEAELFGHKRGAFTGAERSRPGLFRAASGGILFLDEVGDLPLDLQAKLLRTLQQKSVLSVGEDQEVAVDVRVVAATHRDLAAMVRAGQFREDLLQRLTVVSLRIPALRERREDIPTLVAHFLAKHGHPNHARTARPDFLEALALARLPGNVRQLEHLVQGALATAEPDRPLGLVDLPPALWDELADAATVAGPPASAGVAARGDLTLWRVLDEHERATVQEALVRAGGLQSRAAELLGITSRSVYNKLRKHGLASR